MDFCKVKVVVNRPGKKGFQPHKTAKGNGVRRRMI